MAGKLLVPWKNKTAKHPNGVCEAATMLWLSRTDQKGLKYANTLTPEDCDALQSKVEAGDTFVFLLPPMLLPTSHFHPLDAVPPSLDALKALKTGDFIFVNANGLPGIGGHAMGIYRNANILYFFDPEFGIYSYDFNSIADLNEVLGKTKNYGEVGYCLGDFTPPPKP
ncbi:hypothetical protein [Pseudomonas purpurea]|uniref:hypothetical protein n=1 Tax=Pseudomonas purpurea TaxID=3136737 RepID=UPI003267C6DB